MFHENTYNVNLRVNFDQLIRASRNNKILRFSSFQRYQKCKSGLDIGLRGDMESTSKLLDDLLWNIETQPYSFWIQISVLFNITKQLEEFTHVLLLDANSRINYLYLDHAILSFQKEWNKLFANKIWDFCYVSADNCDASSTLCELEGIWL